MATMGMTAEHRPLYRRLYFQVICAIVIGVVIGAVAPQTGESLMWLGDGFVKLIKMMIAPIIFTTVAVGIAKWEGALDHDRLQRVLNRETDEEADEPETALDHDLDDYEAAELAAGHSKPYAPPPVRVYPDPEEPPVKRTGT